MTNNTSKIIWTKIDEAPALATYSLLPIVNAFTRIAGVTVETSDISLAGRIISNFPENLTDEQKIPDNLSILGDLTQVPEANIIKLPNISASVPQLKAAVKELQEKGYNIPDYPDEPKNEDENIIKQKYSKVLGSAVNPVLREGNADRRAAVSVKKFAQKFPHKMMKDWPDKSKCHVSHMNEKDFYGNELSVNIKKDTGLKIVLEDGSGKQTELKKDIRVDKNEIIDCTFISVEALRSFYEKEIADAKDKDVLLSLHLKATMMKVSDPIMFGHAVSVYYKEILNKYSKELDELGFNPNNGINDLYIKIANLPADQRQKIEKDIELLYNERPKQAMVDSDKGITNLHVPNNIIVDASMPNVIRDGGKMWGPDGKLHDTKALIPDRSYATMYQEVINDCKQFGQFDPATMGNVSNVGLMAKKAEEYGSHPTTFEIPEKGILKVKDSENNILTEHNVEKGDIWRMSKVKEIAVKDWVKLAVKRAKATGSPAVFWLDEQRAHDDQIIKKAKEFLKEHDTSGIEIHFLAPSDAMKFTLKRIRKGENTISVTGNVLRDYLTDLFPILELGTSAKMLSIVPLLAGGGLFETGAGGSAPKHVQQFLTEGHLRWDSLGEFLALTVSLEHLSQNFNNEEAQILADTLDAAVSKYLENGKSPSRKAGELDNRGTHFFLAKYWAESLANQDKNDVLKEKFSAVSKELAKNEKVILAEIASLEGKPTDLGGYYLPDDKLAENAMRPSNTLNAIIDSI